MSYQFNAKNGGGNSKLKNSKISLFKQFIHQQCLSDIEVHRMTFTRASFETVATKNKHKFEETNQE
jgi:hypothetical protein